MDTIEKELQRVNRALSTVSACHKVLVRSKEKSELFQQICQAIVDTGGYRMASNYSWKGMRIISFFLEGGLTERILWPN